MQVIGSNLTLQAPPTEAGVRLDRFLHARLPEHSRARIQEWIRLGRVQVNGAPARPSYRLKGGERIVVQPAAPPPLKAAPEPIPIEVLYEDEDLVAVNKPAGMIVHAGAGRRSGTLVNALLHRYGKLSEVGGEERPGIVHRLDRYTSGVLLVARHDAAHRHLAAQFAARRIEKTYLALVHGKVKTDHGVIDSPIARDPVRRVRMSARLGRGRTALTEYRVLRRFGAFTYLEIHLHTGRTHQIRTHLAAIGHPVVGDRLYGAPRQIEGFPPLERYLLHAYRIRFTHPGTARPMTVEAPLPEEMLAWLARLERSSDA